jgi:hypothetical protein
MKNITLLFLVFFINHTLAQALENSNTLVVEVHNVTDKIGEVNISINGSTVSASILVPIGASVVRSFLIPSGSSTLTIYCYTVSAAVETSYSFNPHTVTLSGTSSDNIFVSLYQSGSYYYSSMDANVHMGDSGMGVSWAKTLEYFMYGFGVVALWELGAMAIRLTHRLTGTSSGGEV